MNMGEFARLNNISMDTIRYYIDLGLLSPVKEGDQFCFDESCQEGLEHIRWLKDSGFTPNEMHKAMSFFGSFKVTDELERTRFGTLLENKLLELQQKKKQLEQGISQVRHKLHVIRNGGRFEGVTRLLGLPFVFLPLLVCPACSDYLELAGGYIENGRISEGELKCACGRNGMIRDGIIITDSTCDKGTNSFEVVKGEYLEGGSPEYTAFIFRGLDWLVKRMSAALPPNGTILQTGPAAGYFLGQAGPRLPVGSVYIAVDNNFDRLSHVKSIAEKEIAWYTSRNLVFICCDLRNIPLKEESLDMIMDFFGTTSYNSVNSGYPVEWLARKLKRGGRWLGSYMLFRAGSKIVGRFPEGCREFFYQSYISSAFEKSPLMLKESEDIGYISKGGTEESFFVESERVNQWVYYGERVK